MTRFGVCLFVEMLLVVSTAYSQSVILDLQTPVWDCLTDYSSEPACSTILEKTPHTPFYYKRLPPHVDNRTEEDKISLIRRLAEELRRQ